MFMIGSIRRGLLVQYGLAVVVSLSALTAGGWLTWPSSVNPHLQRGDVCCTATTSEVSTMVALMDFGNMITPIPTSYLSDLFGRKRVVHITAVMFIIASICVMLADNIVYIYVARLLAGMVKGIAFAVLPLYLAEIAEVNVRGALGTLLNTFVSFGISYDYIFGAFLSYQGLNIANLVVPVVFGIAFFFVPESPYFLMMKGKEEASLECLSKCRQSPITDQNLKDELREIKRTVETDMKNKGRFIDVVSTKSNRRALMITSLAAFFQRLSGISPLLAFGTLTLPEKGGGASRDIYVIIFSFLILVGNYIGTTLVDKWGRKALYLLSTISCGVVDAIFAVFFTIRSSGVDVSDYNWIPYAAILLFGIFWGVGMSIVPSILVGELFPTNIKSYASSIQSIMFALASLSENKLYGEIYPKYGFEIMFYIFTAGCVVCAIFTQVYIFETKGKTFLEIQKQLHEITNDNEYVIEFPEVSVHKN